MWQGDRRLPAPSTSAKKLTQILKKGAVGKKKTQGAVGTSYMMGKLTSTSVLPSHTNQHDSRLVTRSPYQHLVLDDGRLQTALSLITQSSLLLKDSLEGLLLIFLKCNKHF